VFVALSALLALLCLVPGLAKLTGHPKMQASAGHLGIAWVRYRLIGMAELAAAGGVLVGLAWTPLGVAAGLGMGVLLSGALSAHRRAGDGLKDIAPALVTLGISLAYLATALTR
jgi:hypothetical protein